MTRFIYIISFLIAFGKCTSNAQEPQSFVADASYVLSWDEDAIIGDLYTGLQETTYLLHYDAAENRMDIYDGSATRKWRLEQPEVKFWVAENEGIVQRKWLFVHPEFGKIKVTKTNTSTIIETWPTWCKINKQVYYSKS